MKLGIVLARADDLDLALALTTAAGRAGDQVSWFVMAEAVCSLAMIRADLVRQALDDVEIIACATSIDQRACALPTWVSVGSQDDHAGLLAWADRIVALT
jgi:hypothetical protein